MIDHADHRGELSNGGFGSDALVVPATCPVSVTSPFWTLPEPNPGPTVPRKHAHARRAISSSLFFLSPEPAPGSPGRWPSRHHPPRGALGGELLRIAGTWPLKVTTPFPRLRRCRPNRCWARSPVRHHVLAQLLVTQLDAHHAPPCWKVCGGFFWPSHPPGYIDSGQ